MPRELSIEKIQGYFEMQDRNKELKFNAFTKEQLERVNSFEKHLQNILKDLYVPTPITT